MQRDYSEPTLAERSDGSGPSVDLCTLLRAGDVPSELEAELPPDGNVATISPDFGRALSRLLLAVRPQSVLEFGAGVSSIAISVTLRTLGAGRLTSVEHAPRYSAAAWKRVEQTRVDAALIPCPLVLRPHSQGLIYQYQGIARLRARAPYDFVLVDAPPGSFGRDTVLYQSLPYLAPGALIVMDDAARVSEATVINRWRRACESLDVVCWIRDYARGVAILRYGGQPGLRVSLRNMLGTCHDRFLYRKSVRILRKEEGGEADIL